MNNDIKQQQQQDELTAKVSAVVEKRVASGGDSTEQTLNGFRTPMPQQTTRVFTNHSINSGGNVANVAAPTTGGGGGFANQQHQRGRWRNPGWHNGGGREWPPPRRYYNNNQNNNNNGGTTQKNSSYNNHFPSTSVYQSQWHNNKVESSSVSHFHGGNGGVGVGRFQRNNFRSNYRRVASPTHYHNSPYYNRRNASGQDFPSHHHHVGGNVDFYAPVGNNRFVATTNGNTGTDNPNSTIGGKWTLMYHSTPTSVSDIASLQAVASTGSGQPTTSSFLSERQRYTRTDFNTLCGLVSPRQNQTDANAATPPAVTPMVTMLANVDQSVGNGSATSANSEDVSVDTADTRRRAPSVTSFADVVQRNLPVSYAKAATSTNRPSKHRQICPLPFEILLNLPVRHEDVGGGGGTNGSSSATPSVIGDGEPSLLTQNHKIASPDSTELLKSLGLNVNSQTVAETSFLRKQLPVLYDLARLRLVQQRARSTEANRRGYPPTEHGLARSGERLADTRLFSNVKVEQESNLEEDWDTAPPTPITDDDVRTIGVDEEPEKEDDENSVPETSEILNDVAICGGDGRKGDGDMPIVTSECAGEPKNPEDNGVACEQFSSKELDDKEHLLKIDAVVDSGFQSEDGGRSESSSPTGDRTVAVVPIVHQSPSVVATPSSISPLLLPLVSVPRPLPVVPYYLQQSHKPSVETLTEQIFDFYRTHRQSELLFRKKIQLRDALYSHISPIFRMCGLYIIGSSLNGFGCETSDMDLCLLTSHKEVDQSVEAIEMLTSVEDTLKEKCPFIDGHSLIRAKVPILRLMFKGEYRDLHQVDLNVNNHVTIRNTHLLYSYAKYDWRVQPLVIVVKAWAKARGINDALKSTLSSYSLALMTVHYLQCGVSPAVLPSLQRLHPSVYSPRSDVRLLHCPSKALLTLASAAATAAAAPPCPNQQSLGQLFLGFLEYYAKRFDYNEDAISIRLGKKIKRADVAKNRIGGVANGSNHLSQWRCFCIEEPFTLTNAAHSVYDEMAFDKMKMEFVSSYDALRKQNDFAVVLKPREPPLTTVDAASAAE